jgi:hypothetical protein
MVCTTAITKPAAFGWWWYGRQAAADKTKKAKANADDVRNWLFQQCKQAKVNNMMTDQTPLTISLAVLQALCKIEVDIPESMDVCDEMAHEFEYANYFFDAFKRDMYKKRDVHFIHELAANTTQMNLEKDLNDKTLTVQASK